MGLLQQIFRGLDPPEREKKQVGNLQEILLGYGGSSSGERVSPSTAMQCSTVYACVGLIAETVAMLPLKVYRRRKGGRGRDEARDHWLWLLLSDNPNSWMTSYELREWISIHLALRGNAYCYKVQDRSGRVVELLPLHPDYVKVEQAPDFRLTYHITHPDGRCDAVGQDHIWHVRYRSLDGYQGVSPISYHRETIGLAIAATKHGARTLRNGARPGGVLTVPGALTPEQIDRLRTSWAAYHGGERSGGTAILEAGTDFKPLSVSNEDLQYLQTREYQVEDIARIYRVPLHMIQCTGKSTSWGSGIEAMGIGYTTYTLTPWLRRLESTIKRDLIPAKEQGSIYAEFEINGLLRGDIKSRYEAYSILLDRGVICPNEVRDLENLNPREGGDEYLTPLNMQVGALGVDPAEEEAGNAEADN